MAQKKSQFVCDVCGHQTSQWKGQCSACKSWNSLHEQLISSKTAHYAGAEMLTPVALESMKPRDIQRFKTGQVEFDRVLGGGLVPGSVVLLGGDPGVGKSTILLQIFCAMDKGTALYVSGEESLEQLALRATMVANPQGQVLSATDNPRVLAVAEKMAPQLLILDSIQTLMDAELSSAPGSVAQVRHVTASWVRFAKQSGAVVIIVGHVTKEGQIAGPRVLEHMVDTVLYFEGEQSNRYRMIRAVKNRFGPTHEVGLFAMTDEGLRSVTNPSKLFLVRDTLSPGSAASVIWHGSRPLLLEIQALVTRASSEHLRRSAVGFEPGRLGMLIAILHKYLALPLQHMDVFINVAGGMKISETAADLALLLALISSLRDRPLPHQWIAFGEVGLTGEVRPVFNGEARIQAAKAQGFQTIICSKHNSGKQQAGVHGIGHVRELAHVLQRTAEKTDAMT